MDGVVNVAPVAIAVPPVEAAYQLTIPALAVTLKATVPVPQRLPGLTLVIIGISFTVATTAVLEVVVHDAFVAST